jgi:hypothetical protein
VSAARYACCDERRRAAIAGRPGLNAIDYLEVADLAPGELEASELAEYNALPADERDRLLWQRRLTVHFVNPLTAQQLAGLSGDTIEIRGGDRIRGIRVDVLSTSADAVVLRATPAGDFSRYTLALVRSASDPRPPVGFDPVLSEVPFSFKVDCDTGFDCRPERECPEPIVEPPEIDYLAKDYASFRRLIIDRMTLLAPDWRERNPADLGIALVELLAYVGDHLSYRQDAVATEAYLGTARRRVSARRHALLVDYAMHDGCNARAWLHVEVSADAVLQPGDLVCFTHVPRLGPRVAPGSPEHQAALDARPEWFEGVVPSLDPDAPPAPLSLFADLNELKFHTWGDERCCLPAGATRATLRGHHPDLAEGAVVVFEEVKGPLTGSPADADARHRHAVRLSRVVHTGDAGPLTDPLDDAPITEIEWHPEDALPFPLCVSARTEDDEPVADVSVARGNVALVDHGRSVSEDLGAVPEARMFVAAGHAAERCEPPPRQPVHPRFRPALDEAPLTQTGTVLKTLGTPERPRFERVRFDPDGPAAAAFRHDLRDARPAILLESGSPPDTTRWAPARDLLSAAGDSARFVVETEQDGTAHLRFGDDEHGRRPPEGEAFTAAYRVGNGVAGNVGADSIVHALTLDARIVAVRNPLPAAGGIDPETITQVRRRAPQAFRTQERAVTPADYEAVTVRDPSVQRAAATFRWTGSWNTVFLTVDRFDGQQLDEELERDLTRHVDRYRMAGHDLEFDDPRFVSLELELFVCVRPDYFRSDVKQRLLEVLSNRELGPGRRGLFHPDNFSFGQTIYLSPILAAARDVPGVASANVVTFQRQGIDETTYLDAGRLPLGRLEIARLDNDPNFPEHGVIRIEMSGGK